MWAAIAGLAHLGVVTFGFVAYPYLYGFLIAVGYGLMLPPIAVLHVRHVLVRQSGAILATIAGNAALTVGLGGSVNVDLRPAALFILGIWWWTIGKMWAQTRIFPPPAGQVTAALGVLMLAGTAIQSATVLSDLVPGYPATDIWTISQLALGTWLIATGVLLWRSEA